jgi:hypothetical protein
MIMHIGVIIFVGLITIGVVAALVGRYLSRKRLTRRNLLPVSEIISELPANIPKKNASEILTKIGELFGIPAGVLRLDDSVSMLTEMDSWKLGEGQEKFEAWLKAQGITHLLKETKTIGDLVISIIDMRP